MEEVKQDFSDLITSATEAVKQVTISSVLPSTAGTQDDNIKEINTSRPTGNRSSKQQRKMSSGHLLS